MGCPEGILGGRNAADAVVLTRAMLGGGKGHIAGVHEIVDTHYRDLPNMAMRRTLIQGYPRSYPSSDVLEFASEVEMPVGVATCQVNSWSPNESETPFPVTVPALSSANR